MDGLDQGNLVGFGAVGGPIGPEEASALGVVAEGDDHDPDIVPARPLGPAGLAGQVLQVDVAHGSEGVLQADELSSRRVLGEDRDMRQQALDHRRLGEYPRPLMRLIEEGDDVVGRHVLDQAAQDDAAAGVGHRHVEMGQDLEPWHIGKQVL